MKDTGRSAIARITIRDKQSLAALRVLDNVLVLETIFFPDEVRPVSQIPGIPEDSATDQRELEMAKQLIENLTSEFQPEKYVDTYREALLEMIHRKVEGEEIVSAPEAPQRNVIDLMAALQASLDRAQELRREAKASASGKGKGRETPLIISAETRKIFLPGCQKNLKMQFGSILDGSGNWPQILGFAPSLGVRLN